MSKANKKSTTIPESKEAKDARQQALIDEVSAERGHDFMALYHLYRMAHLANGGDAGQASALISTIQQGCKLLENLSITGTEKGKAALKEAAKEHESLPIDTPAQRWSKDQDKTTGERMLEELPFKNPIWWNQNVRANSLNRILIGSIDNINLLRRSEADCNWVSEEYPCLKEWVSGVASLAPLNDGNVEEWAEYIIQEWVMLSQADMRVRVGIGMFDEGTDVFSLANPERRKRRRTPTLIAQIARLTHDYETGETGKSQEVVGVERDELVEQLRNIDQDPENVLVGLREKLPERIRTLIKV